MILNSANLIIISIGTPAIPVSVKDYKDDSANLITILSFYIGKKYPCFPVQTLVEPDASAATMAKSAAPNLSALPKASKVARTGKALKDHLFVKQPIPYYNFFIMYVRKMLSCAGRRICSPGTI